MSALDQPGSSGQPLTPASIATLIAAARVFLDRAPALAKLQREAVTDFALKCAEVLNDSERHAGLLRRREEQPQRAHAIYESLRPTFGPLSEAIRLCQGKCPNFEALAAGTMDRGAQFAIFEIESLAQILETRRAELELVVPPAPPNLKRLAAKILLALADGGHEMEQVDLGLGAKCSVRSCGNHLPRLMELGLVKKADEGRGYMITDAGRAAARSIRVPRRKDSV